MSDISPKNFRVVLSADRTQMADYRTLLDGMVSAGQTTTTPFPLMSGVLARPVPSAGVRAKRAPLGLRRIEAALLDGGFPPGEVAVVPPEKISRAIGAGTRIVGLSSGDPLGLGMNSSTMTGIAGGRPYTTVLFRRLLAGVRRLTRSFPRVKLVVGGAGAWQLAQRDALRRKLGIDHVMTGCCEAEVADVFRRIIAGEALPNVIECRWSQKGAIPRIRGSSIMGLVEISRGCGLGCDFCTIADLPMTHLSVDAVLADARTNLAAGPGDVALVSEDIFRYGGKTPGETNPRALIRLLRELRAVPGLRAMQPLHGNISSVAAFSDAELDDVRGLLAGPGDRKLWVNVGVETASGELLTSAGCRSKMRPFPASDWGEVCGREVRRLARIGFMPMVSLVVGLPGETAGHVKETRRWVRALRGERMLVFPVFLAPITPGAHRFADDDVTPAHWRLFEECYRFNFKWNLRLIREEQAQIGAPLARRLAFALLGPFYVLGWRTLLALKS